MDRVCGDWFGPGWEAQDGENNIYNLRAAGREMHRGASQPIKSALVPWGKAREGMETRGIEDLHLSASQRSRKDSYSWSKQEEWGDGGGCTQYVIIISLANAPIYKFPKKVHHFCINELFVL